MTSPATRRHWTALLAWGLLLLVAGAALATWSLAEWRGAAQFLGVAPRPPAFALRQAPPPTVFPTPAATDDATRTRIADLEGRLAAIEDRTRRAAGSAGRADALLIAFAARRAVERGVPLGYLEPLLAQRFGASAQRAVATVITTAARPTAASQPTAGRSR